MAHCSGTQRMAESLADAVLREALAWVSASKLSPSFARDFLTQHDSILRHLREASCAEATAAQELRHLEEYLERHRNPCNLIKVRSPLKTRENCFINFLPSLKCNRLKDR